MKSGTRVLVGVGAAVAVYFVWSRYASAAKVTSIKDQLSGLFGAPGFVAPSTPTSPATVTGCSFARAGTILVDANTGKEISEAEAARRAKLEGCTVPPPLPFVGTKTSAANIFAGAASA